MVSDAYYRCCNRCGCILADDGMQAQDPAAPHHIYCPYASADLQRRLVENDARIDRNMPWRHP